MKDIFTHVLSESIHYKHERKFIVILTLQKMLAFKTHFIYLFIYLSIYLSIYLFIFILYAHNYHLKCITGRLYSERKYLEVR